MSELKIRNAKKMSNNRSGAKVTGLTRFLEYSDGSAMYDGSFYDVWMTSVGYVLPGGSGGGLLTQSTSGATQRSPSGGKKSALGKSQSHHHIVIAGVKGLQFCEKTLIENNHLCMDEAGSASVVTVDASLEITMNVSHDKRQLWKVTGFIFTS